MTQFSTNIDNVNKFSEDKSCLSEKTYQNLVCTG